MATKSLIDSRKFVPQYFGNGREFQVFLRAVNIALSVVKSNTDNFIPNLLNPLKCKARLLPLLSNYVGYNYNPRERVFTNRWITKLYPLLIRNRGNEIGITLAIAMSICLMGNPDELNLEHNFTMEYEEDKDEYGRLIPQLKIYMNNNDYLPILKDMLEVVRPAGTKITFIPSANISSTETIHLTDETIIAKYDYITGKLLSLNGIDIVVKNSWEVLYDEQILESYTWGDVKDWQWGNTLFNGTLKKIMSNKTWGELKHNKEFNKIKAMLGLAPYIIDEDVKDDIKSSTNIWLTDGIFKDQYGNEVGRYVDPITGYIRQTNQDPDEQSLEFIKDARIYIHTPEGDKYTGMYFDVSNPAKVMNTYYKLLDDGVFSGFMLSEDDYTIYNISDMSSAYKLELMEVRIDGNLKDVLKVVDAKTNKRYNWHVDIETRQFIRDKSGSSLNFDTNKIPFSETTYIGKKPFIVNITRNEKMHEITSITPTNYYVNKYGDIVDTAGNIILSKKDRYKVSDSTMIGFSEIHNNIHQLSTYDGTSILQREWSFMKDNDIQNILKKDSYEDYPEYNRVKDPRYRFDNNSFIIGNPVREYTGNKLIRFISNDELSEMRQDNGWIKIPLFIEDNENASGELQIQTDIPYNFSLGDVFNQLNIRYEECTPNDEINPKWDIYIDWVANPNNASIFNLNELMNPLHFIKCGTIEPRTLHWTGHPIIITPKIYDGSNKVYTKGAKKLNER